MALLFCDSFDHYATADMAKKWTIPAGTIGAFGRNGTNGQRDPINGFRSLPASGATAIVGEAVKPRTAFSSLQVFFEMMGNNSSADANRHCWLRFNGDGSLSFVNAAGTVIAGPSAWTGSLGTYYYIEMKVFLSTTVGTVTVRVDGTVVLSGTGLGTQNGLLTNVWTGFRQTSSNIDVDDLYVCDGSGSDNNDFLGDCRVETLLPQTDATSAGSNAGLTPSTGTDHGALVDETTPNGDTDYNSSATAGAKDTYQFPNMSSTGAVKAVQVLLYARKSDQATKTLCPVVRHAGIDFDGTTQTAAIDYEYKRQVYERNPGTSVAFTGSDIANLQVGMKVVA